MQILRGRLGRGGQPSIILLLTIGLVTAACLLTPAYLTFRALEGGASTLSMLGNAQVLHTLGRSLILVCLVVFGAVLLAVPLAWVTTRTDLPFRRTFSVLLSLPLVIPSYVFSFLMISVAGPKGTIQNILEPIGVDRLPEIYGLPGATLTLVLLTFPYVFLPVRAAIQNIDASLEESARGLAEGPFGAFRRVTLPLLGPSITAGALLVGLYTLSDFGAVSLFQYETFTWVIYSQYESAFDRTLASLLSLVLVVTTLVLVSGQYLARRSERYHRVVPGVPRHATQTKLNRWKWITAMAVMIIIGISLIIPIAVLAFWAVRGVIAGEPIRLLWIATANSVSLSLITALVASILAIPVAYAIVRFPGWRSRLVEQVSYIGFALPGIAIGLALVSFSTRYAGFLYQSLFLLVFAFVILFLPASVGPVQAAIRQMSPRMEEASRTLGIGTMRTFQRVVFPLIARGVFVGGSLVFLLTMKELPGTLILSPLNYRTLPTYIWDAASEAFFAQAAIPSLFLVVCSGIPLAILINRNTPSSGTPHED